MQWGRKQYRSWPSRRPVWSGVVLVVLLVIACSLMWQYEEEWTFLQRNYLPIYMRTWVRGSLLPTNTAVYDVFDVVYAHSEERLAVGNEVEPVTHADGTVGYRLTDEARREGIVKLRWRDGDFLADTNRPGVLGGKYREHEFSDRGLHAYLGQWIYRDPSILDGLKNAGYWGLGAFAVLLCFAIPEDNKRALMLKHGRQLKGPELVTTAEFNRKLGKPDGIALINEERSWWDRVMHDTLSRSLRIPRLLETKHFMLMGDTGTGKTVTIMQILMQAEANGDAVVVYDSKGKLFERFGRLGNGGALLNPLDVRCPSYDLCDEITHPAEALTVAASLFPDRGPDTEKKFFVDATRKIFAYLLNLKPTPEQLIYWLCNEQEIDRLVKGTEHASKIDPRGGPQRAGVLGSLGMVGEALRLLPRASETRQRWSVAEWAKERKGCIFITSQTMVEESLLPLISLWIDLLVLRSMNEGAASKRRVWFVLDELPNLQRLPQLEKAITQGRESNCVMVLGFQGKAQIEHLYGHIAEAMLSSPATRIYMKTSEPEASKWISESIGEIEIERYRETRTQGQSPQSRSSASRQRDTTCEPLVMASEISGLDDLHGYLKQGNYVVRLRVPYLDPPVRNEKFIPREMEVLAPVAAVPPKAEPVVESEVDQKTSTKGLKHYFE